jgi:hypothetical protein
MTEQKEGTLGIFQEHSSSFCQQQGIIAWVRLRCNFRGWLGEEMLEHEHGREQVVMLPCLAPCDGWGGQGN